jgi:uncharacterized protein (TIGR01319 family)
MAAPVVACVDVGSTFTKAVAVDTASGALLASASHPTTIDTDVMDGVDAVLAELAGQGADVDEVRACSSAGGGLRLAIVGQERLVTAEAGRRVGLSAGAKVVHVSAGPLDTAGLAALRADRPDVVLLVGGTDGGDEEVVHHNAGRLARSGPRVPYVVACNADARDDVAAVLRGARHRVIATANVVPRIGVLDPMPARLAIREVFIAHVIGGKKLSRGPRFARLVRGATPDLVLAGVEVLADGAAGVPGAGDVLVVDVGGATSDVYSVLTPDPEQEAARGRDVVETLWRARTVEGDLGMRWSAPGVVAAAVRERLIEDGSALERDLREAARTRHDDVGQVPAPGARGDHDRDLDARLAALALTVALRRHSRPDETPEGVRIPARDLTRVQLVVGSGGVLRHADASRRALVMAPATSDHQGGWRVPEQADVVVDTRYLLAAAGLLAPDHPRAAASLLVGAFAAVGSRP